MKKYHLLPSAVILILLAYIYLQNSQKTSHDFYYWKSSYEVEEGINPPSYIKVLDISYSDTLLVHKTRFKSKVPQNIVPVIYLDNSLWTKMNASTMAQKVLTLLAGMPLGMYEEIQVDCDWTKGSKSSYFEFLTLLEEASGKKLSATIRLHQVKYYRQTGVPPVAYGVLMYYNMSNFQDLETKNYILDLEVAKRYHYNFEDYPLPLNLALALYSQGTIIRFGEVVSIMEGLREQRLNEHFKKIREHLFEVTKTHYFQKRLLYEGDQIRIDEVSKDLLLQSIQGLKEVMKQPEKIIFYRWGNLDFYGRESLNELVNEW
ncbi:MAG: FIG00387823: hypothetical protein [uncultured Sulfurovum sp.]|uniref:Uncharacterized protein n=1 Tax=uncultured Sulfurovum sp. TaxID=269237 RepID=A0A6S6T3A3_9BACT|nr:MAG: FIG00387823: hypothetical protein [uncultured Sulfurovum sp.]